MKKFFTSLLVAVLCFAVSCGGSSSEKKEVIEETSKAVSAEEGGEITVAGGTAKIKIPAGALAKDTEITVKLFKTNGFNNKNALAADVVEFGPSGTVFKKPIIITINAGKAVKGETVAAAVMKSDGTWSFSKNGAYAVFGGYDEAGDPIMTTAAGDPIMLNAAGDPIMTNAAGDPIMLSAAGDPIMLVSAGDPIMTNAAGDPIMNAAAGDPIMMTTGHFSSYTFVIVDEVDDDDDDDEDDDTHSGEVTCKTVKEWDEIDGSLDGDYDDENSDSYCRETGEELVYCIEGAFADEDSDLYSIKVGSKEFKCESDNNEDCIFEMQQYCGHIDGEYEDGYYCEDDGVCGNTGEAIKTCVATDGGGDYYYQTGDKKFECSGENIEQCYFELEEYCGSTDGGDTEEEDPGLVCRTESEWAEEFSNEDHHQWICETTGIESRSAFRRVST